MNHYETLGVPEDASQADIKRAYRKKASESHPDRADDKEAAGRAMVAINQAYETLGDAARRAHYDQTGQDVHPNIQADAIKLVMSVLNHVLENGDDTNIPNQARDALRSRIKQMQSNNASLTRLREMVTKKRDRVKTKGGKHNLFHQLVDSRLVEINRTIEQLSIQIKLHEAALELLADYEANDPPPAPKTLHPMAAYDDLQAFIVSNRGPRFFNTGGL